MAKKNAVTKERVDQILRETRRASSARPAGIDGKRKSLTTNYDKLDSFERGRSKGPNQLTGGRNLKDTPRDTVQNLTRADRANAELKARGESDAKKPSMFSRVIDVLSRGAYSTFAAADANQEEFYQSRAQGEGVLKSLKDGFVAGARDWDDGLQGKKKITASEFIQNTADNRDAIKKGQDPAKTVQGQAKVNKFVKHGGGFLLDVFGDPTTYVGAGLVSKAASITPAGKKALLTSKEAAEGLEATVATIGKVARNNKNITPQAVRDLVATHRAPVEAIKRKDFKTLSPAAKVLATELRAERKKHGFKRRGAVETAHFGKTIEGSGSRAYFDFSSISDPRHRKLLEDVHAEEFAAIPGLHQSLKNSKVGDKYEFSNDFETAFAWANPNGKIRFNPNFKNPRYVYNATTNAINDTDNWFSVKVKRQTDFVRFISIHEMGHQMAFSLGKGKRKRLFDQLAAKHFGGTDIIDDDFNVMQALSVYGAKNKEELFAESWAEFRMMGDQARPFAQDVGKYLMQHVADAPADMASKKLLNNLAKTTVAAARGDAEDVIIKEFAEKGIDNWTDADLHKKVNDLLAEQGITTSKALKQEIMEASLRNLSPTISKEFKVRVGTAQLTVPGVASAARMAGRTAATVPGVRRSVQAFQKHFQANAHIPSALTTLRNRTTVLGANVVREYTRELHSVFEQVPKESRKAAIDSWRALNREGGKLPEGASLIKGGISAFNNQPVPDVLRYFDGQLREISEHIENLGLTNDEINRFLMDAYRIKEPAFITKEIQTKGGKAVKQTSTVNPHRLIADVQGNVKVTDPALALHFYHAAVNKAIARREMYKQFGQSFGVPVGNNFDKPNALVRTLKAEGYRAPVIADIRGIEGIGDMVFHPEIAKAIEQIDHIFSSPRETDTVLRYFDSAQQAFKAVVTKYNPSFHTRTLIGEQFLSYLGGIRNPIRANRLASQVMRGRNQQFLGNGFMGGVNATNRAERSIAQRHNVLRGDGSTQFADDAAPGNKVLVRTKQGKTLTADQIWHLYMNSGLKSGYASSDLVKGADSRVFGGKLSGIRNVAQDTTETVEDFSRMAHFIDVLSHSKAKTFEEALEEATETVTKFHLDYTAVTKTEREVMTRVMPFYKWLRLSTPLMAEVLLTQPGKAAVVPKAMQALSGLAGYDTSELGAFPGGPDAVVPEWLESAVPIANIAGNTNYWSPLSTFPLASSAELGDTNPMDVLTPLIGTPVEYFQGKDKFNQPTRDGAVPTTKFGAMQTPQTGFAYNMIANPDPDIPRWQRVAQFLANPGIQPNTDKRMLSASMQEMTAAEKKRKELRDKKGGNPP